MDMLGHCEIALRSGLHDAEEVYGEGLLDLMLPNMLHCHDWAYAHMWQVDQRPEDLLPAARLVRSHIVADWVIHYGDEETHRKRKCGWAYRRMGMAKVASERFFANAGIAGLLLPEAVLPAYWNKKQQLDFHHSIIEYCLDILLADALPMHHFRRMKAVLSGLCGPDGAYWRARVNERFARLGATSDHDAIFLARSVEGMARDAVAADRPDHFAIATVVRKYGFIDEPTAYAYIRRWLEEIAAQLDPQDVEHTLSDISEVVADPLSIYTGSFCAAPVAGGTAHECGHA